MGLLVGDKIRLQKLLARAPQGHGVEAQEAADEKLKPRAVAPLADSLDVGGSLEVVSVGRLAQPTSLTVAFAGLFAGIGTAEALASAVARIPFEQPARMQSPG